MDVSFRLNMKPWRLGSFHLVICAMQVGRGFGNAGNLGFIRRIDLVTIARQFGHAGDLGLGEIRSTIRAEFEKLSKPSQ